MNTLELTQREISAALERQLQEDAGFDAKAGLIFAYDGALALACLSLGHEGPLSDSAFTAALIFAAEGVALALAALWPVRLNVPPEPRLFALIYGQEPATPANPVLAELIRAQLEAVDENERGLRKKLRFLVGAAAFSVAALAAFAVQAVSRPGSIVF